MWNDGGHDKPWGSSTPGGSKGGYHAEIPSTRDVCRDEDRPSRQDAPVGSGSGARKREASLGSPPRRCPVPAGRGGGSRGGRPCRRPAPGGGGRGRGRGVDGGGPDAALPGGEP